MKCIRIVFILPSLAGGGAEKVLLNLLDNIDDFRFEPYLILLNDHGPLKPKLNKKNIIVLNKVRMRNSFFSLIREIKSLKPEVIFSTFPHITLPLLFIKNSFFKKTKFITREPNMLDKSLDNSPYSFLIKILHKFYSNRSNKIIVTSKMMKKDFLKRGIKENKLALVSNPIDYKKLRKIDFLKRHKGEGLRLVFVGRLVYQKGIDRVIPLLKSNHNIHLTIIGDGPYKERVNKLVNKYNLYKQVKFLGFLYNANEYVAAADYCILPSRWEGLPNVALESLILGTPVLTFQEVVGLYDIKSHVSDKKLIFFKDEKEMAENLSNLKQRVDWKKPNLRKSLINNFNDPTEYSQKIEKIIMEEILG